MGRRKLLLEKAYIYYSLLEIGFIVLKYITFVIPFFFIVNASANDIFELDRQKNDELIAETVDLGFVVDNQTIDQQSQPSLQNEGIKGQLQPARDAVLSSQMIGQITKINLKENQYFKKNDTLVEFGCVQHDAELKKAKAMHKADQTRVRINDRLNKLASISQLDYKLSVYKAEESSAEVKIKSNDVKNCKIKAPYTGVVEEVFRKDFEYVQKGDPVIKILDDSILEIELLVPSDWITWIEKDLIFDVIVSEIGQRYEAKVTSIGAKIDPISQSIMIKGSISNQDKLLKPGMSITAHFKR